MWASCPEARTFLGSMSMMLLLARAPEAHWRWCTRAGRCVSRWLRHDPRVTTFVVATCAVLSLLLAALVSWDGTDAEGATDWGTGGARLWGCCWSFALGGLVADGISTMKPHGRSVFCEELVGVDPGYILPPLFFSVAICMGCLLNHGLCTLCTGVLLPGVSMALCSCAVDGAADWLKWLGPDRDAARRLLRHPVLVRQRRVRLRGVTPPAPCPQLNGLLVTSAAVVLVWTLVLAPGHHSELVLRTPQPPLDPHPWVRWGDFFPIMAPTGMPLGSHGDAAPPGLAWAGPPPRGPICCA